MHMSGIWDYIAKYGSWYAGISKKKTDDDWLVLAVTSVGIAQSFDIRGIVYSISIFLATYKHTIVMS